MDQIPFSFNLPWSPSAQKAALIWGISLLIFLIILLILGKLLSSSLKAATQNNGRINQYLAAVPAERIGTVNAVYQHTRKSLGHAMMIGLVGGIFGLQRAYLGKRRAAVWMLLLFWTGIPSIISVFDLMTMPRVVSEYNLNVIQSLYDQIAMEKSS